MLRTVETSNPTTALVSRAWFRVCWTWLFYLGFGSIGIWHAWNGQSNSLLLMIASIGLATVPMVVLHELGHLVAAWFVGLRCSEFSIGSGAILWRTEIRGMQVTVRALPICGHVSTLLERSPSPPLRQFIYVAGGPLANVAAVATLFSVRESSGWTGIKNLGLADIGIAANVWLLFLTLYPAKGLQTQSGSTTATDGWMLLQLMRGRSQTEIRKEVLLPRNDFGLPAVSKLARTQRMYGFSLYSVVIGIFLTLSGILWFFGRKPNVYGLATVVTLVPVFLTCWLVWRLRRNPLDYVAPRAKDSLSPLVRLDSLIGAELHPILVDQLRPGSERLKTLVTRGAKTDDEGEELLSGIAGLATSSCAKLLVVDLLISSGRYDEAEDAIRQVVESRSDWSSVVRLWLENITLIIQFARTPSLSLAAKIDQHLDTLVDDGLKLHLLVSTSFHALRLHEEELVPTARRWLDQAEAIYPFDSTVNAGLARWHIAHGALTEANTHLKFVEDAYKTESERHETMALRLLWDIKSGKRDAIRQVPGLLRSEMRLTAKRYFLANLARLELEWEDAVTISNHRS